MESRCPIVHATKKVMGGLEAVAYALDPEIADALASIVAARGTAPAPLRGDWKQLRENNGLPYLAALVAPSLDVETASFFTTAKDGAEIELRWYTKRGSSPGSAITYAHGGGMIMGDLDDYDTLISSYASVSGVPFLSVGYRLAPEVSGDTLAEDMFAGFIWLVEHASELGINPRRIAIMGDSGGGGVAAGAAIIARDRQFTPARQILIYPMLDDRTVTPDPSLEPFLTWTYDNNFTAWSAVLGDAIGSDTVSPYSVPARLRDVSDLVPAYIEVGELDIFRSEDTTFAQRLAQNGVSVELHVHTGAPHGFDRFSPSSKLTRRAMSDRVRVMRSI
jgi:acetyl esterase/lipase